MPRGRGRPIRRRSRSKGFGGRGVVGIVTDYRGDTWRSIYTVSLVGAVYVLHAFQKESKMVLPLWKRNWTLSGGGWPRRNAATQNGRIDMTKTTKKTAPKSITESSGKVF